MSEQIPAIRYASIEFDTRSCDQVIIWNTRPSKKIEKIPETSLYPPKIWWLGSMSDVVGTYTINDFINLFGRNNLPLDGQCKELRITS